jgi:hypothetical protein
MSQPNVPGEGVLHPRVALFSDSVRRLSRMSKRDGVRVPHPWQGETSWQDFPQGRRLRLSCAETVLLQLLTLSCPIPFFVLALDLLVAGEAEDPLF